MGEFYAPTSYNIEIWSSTGGVLADISRLAQQREFILTRNAAMQITFQVDLTAFEALCSSINTNPSTLLAPYQSDIKLKRNGAYLGEVCQITGLEFTAQAQDSGTNPETGSFNATTTVTEYVKVTAVGYLSILNDRYYTGSFTSVDSGTIAVSLINATQSLMHGSLGINTATATYATGNLYSPTYSNQNILNELGNLTSIPGALFDIWLDTDKNLHTAALQGNLRNDLKLTYGGPGSNVAGLYHQRTAAGALYNEIIGIGSGTGTDALTSTQDNATSQINYFLRQKVMTYNNVTTQAQLNANVAGELAMDSKILDVPQMIINGTVLANIPFIGAGDRVPLSFPTHRMFTDIDGQYFRIEQMDVKLDDNDFENEIILTLDNYGFTQGT